MRVVIDGSCWANRRGFGRFTRCLLHELAALPGHEFSLLVDEPSLADPTLPPLPSMDVVPVSVSAAPAVAAGAASSRRLGDMLRMTRAARQLKGDVVFFPATYSYFPIIGTPVVATIHDAIAERLPELTLPTTADRWRWRLKERVALRQSRLIVTVSEASRRAIVEDLGVPARKVRVVREAPAAAFEPLAHDVVTARVRTYGLAPGGYLLYVGGISPHKNVAILVDAFERLAPAHPTLRLVLVGDTSDDPFLSSASSVRGAIGRSPVADRVVLTGFVPDDDLVALYCGAIATSLPSLGEGFALTAAESAACGTPVVASPDPAIRELLGDAGVYAAADDAAALAAELDHLVRDPVHREERADAVRRAVAGTSWRAAAEATVAVLEEALARRG